MIVGLTGLLWSRLNTHLGGEGMKPVKFDIEFTDEVIAARGGAGWR